MDELEHRYPIVILSSRLLEATGHIMVKYTMVEETMPQWVYCLNRVILLLSLMVGEA